MASSSKYRAVRKYVVRRILAKLVIILDTNVLSETIRPEPADPVMRWLAAQEPSEVHVTAITQAEVLYGIERMPLGKRRTALAAAVEGILELDFEGRILPFDEKAAHLYALIVAGREALGHPISQFDAMIAAIARTFGAAIATRNTRHFEHCGITVINPWSSLD